MAAGTCILLAKQPVGTFDLSLWLTAAHVTSNGLNSRVSIDPPDRHGGGTWRGYVVAYDRRRDLSLLFVSNRSAPASMRPMPLWPGRTSEAAQVTQEGFSGYRGFGRSEGRLLKVSLWDVAAYPGDSGGPIYSMHDGTRYLVGISSMIRTDGKVVDWTAGPNVEVIRGWLDGIRFNATQPNGKVHRFVCSVAPTGMVGMQCQTCPPPSTGVPSTIPFAPPVGDADSPPPGGEFVDPEEPVSPPSLPRDDLQKIMESLARVEANLLSEEDVRNIAREELESTRGEVERIGSEIDKLKESSNGILEMQQALNAVQSVLPQIQQLSSQIAQIGRSIEVYEKDTSNLKASVESMLKEFSGLQDDLGKLRDEFSKFKRGRFRAIPQ